VENGSAINLVLCLRVYLHLVHLSLQVALDLLLLLLVFIRLRLITDDLATSIVIGVIGIASERLLTLLECLEDGACLVNAILPSVVPGGVVGIFEVIEQNDEVAALVKVDS